MCARKRHFEQENDILNKKTTEIWQRFFLHFLFRFTPDDSDTSPTISHLRN